MSKRVLVVEDDPKSMQLMKYLLSANGYEVLEAETAKEALDLLDLFKSNLPRVIIMDIKLPGGMDGLQLTKKIKASPETRGIPIIAVTAHAMIADRERALEAGCDAYLPKPINTREFPGVVARYME